MQESSAHSTKWGAGLEVKVTQANDYNIRMEEKLQIENFQMKWPKYSELCFVIKIAPTMDGADTTRCYCSI